MSNSDDCIYCQADKAGQYIGPEYYAAYDAAYDAAIDGASDDDDAAYDHADKVALAAAAATLR